MFCLNKCRVVSGTNKSACFLYTWQINHKLNQIYMCVQYKQGESELPPHSCYNWKIAIRTNFTTTALVFRCLKQDKAFVISHWQHKPKLLNRDWRNHKEIPVLETEWCYYAFESAFIKWIETKMKLLSKLKIDKLGFLRLGIFDLVLFS